jgi:hypothetical protein
MSNEIDLQSVSSRLASGFTSAFPSWTKFRARNALNLCISSAFQTVDYYEPSTTPSTHVMFLFTDYDQAKADILVIGGLMCTQKDVLDGTPIPNFPEVVRDQAQRIILGQEKEIAMMSRWEDPTKIEDEFGRTSVRFCGMMVGFDRGLFVALIDLSSWIMTPSIQLPYAENDGEYW